MATTSRPSSSGFRLPPIDPSVSLLVAAAIAIGILGWVGSSAARVANARQTELRRTKATLAEFADLRRRYEPAVAAESIAWRRTWMELQDLGVLGDDRLDVTQHVTRVAEFAGLREVKVLIGPSDTTGAEKRLSTEGIRQNPASFSLLVECRGNMRAVIAFLGQLPPSVAATQLSLVRQNGRQRHRISLAVYELSFTNGGPVVGSSLERGDAAERGGSRPGG